MIRRNLRVLWLEDSPADAELMRHELERSGLKITAQRTDSAQDFEQALGDFNPHVVVCDHSVANFDTKSAIKMAKAIRPAVPVIVVSGSVDVGTIVSAMRAGAEDVVLKNDLARLVPAIELGLLVRTRLMNLSPRQLEVLRLVAEGHTTPAIAERLKLSAKTVETHRGEVMKRVNIHDLASLVRFAISVGIVIASE
ncbi:MAG: response regulator transcription factor [bacterium]